jgi:hypothetical protein
MKNSGPGFIEYYLGVKILYDGFISSALGNLEGQE